MKSLARHGPAIACAGLIAAPALWALSTQLGLILPDAECASSFRPLLICAVLALVLVLAAARLSWRAPWPGRTGQFTGRMCALLAVALGFAVLLQAVASALLTGCER